MNRIVLLLPLLAVLAFCGFGFLATFEPLDEGTQLTWRLIYGGVALGVLLAMVRVIRGPRAGGEAS